MSALTIVLFIPFSFIVSLSSCYPCIHLSMCILSISTSIKITTNPNWSTLILRHGSDGSPATPCSTRYPIFRGCYSELCVSRFSILRTGWPSGKSFAVELFGVIHLQQVYSPPFLHVPFLCFFVMFSRSAGRGLLLSIITLIGKMSLYRMFRRIHGWDSLL